MEAQGSQVEEEEASRPSVLGRQIMSLLPRFMGQSNQDHNKLHFLLGECDVWMESVCPGGHLWKVVNTDLRV